MKKIQNLSIIFVIIILISFIACSDSKKSSVSADVDNQVTTTLKYFISKTSYYDDSEVLQGYSTYDYDANWNMEKKSDFNASGEPQGSSTFEFDTDGFLVKINNFDADDAPQGYSTFEYNPDSLLIKKNNFDAAGVQQDYSTFQYDLNKILIKESVFNTSNELQEYYEPVYALSQKMIELCKDNDGNLKNYKGYDYDDDNGTMIKESLFNKNSVLLSYSIIDYTEVSIEEE